MLLYCGVLLLAMVSTLIISLPDSEYYHILNKISHSVLGIIEMLGLSSFQVWPYNLALINSKELQINSSVHLYFGILQQTFFWID